MISSATTTREIPLSFLCGRGSNKPRLYGILHQPDRPFSCGVLIVTGRPALRAGRHRLFVLLARMWAQAGIPVMRFDFRGTGDCEGEMGTLDDTSEDIGSAVDAFLSNMPGLRGVVLWGLCGGAADSILYATRDPRVVGIAAVNPWSYDARVRGLATLRRYGTLGVEKIRGWASLPGLSDESRLGVNASEAAEDAGQFDISSSRASAAVNRAYASYRAPNLSKRLADALEKFDGGILLILSGQDPGSRAFKHAASISLRWRRLLSAERVRIHDLPESNHSLRRPEWRAQAAAWTLDWVREIESKINRR
jgi:exosortase A-associated hydrolase 1